MTLWFVVCTSVLQNASLGFDGNHIQLAIMVALGSVSFIIGTILRRTRTSRNDLPDSQSYHAWQQRVAVVTSRGAMPTHTEATVPQNNPNAA